MGKGARRLDSRPVEALPAEPPPVQGSAVSAFHVYDDLPWLRRVRIEAGEFTLIWNQMLLPGSPVPWERVAAYRGSWTDTRVSHGERGSAPADLLDQLREEARAVMAFHLLPLRGGDAFTRTQSGPGSMRTVFRCVGSDQDAFIVLRLSDAAAVLFSGPAGEPTLRTTGEHCNYCDLPPADCWHAHLLRQVASSQDSNFIAGAVEAIASGAATVRTSLSDDADAVVTLPEVPELTMFLRFGNSPFLSVADAVGGWIWRLSAAPEQYGLPESDIRLLAEAAERALTAQKGAGSND